MKRTVTAAVALVGAAALAATAFAAPASAVPTRKGTTEIIPNATLESLLVSVQQPFAAGDQGGVEFGVVGNPADGTIEHVGGLTISTLAGDEVALRNFVIDLNSGTVSASVRGAGQVELFDLDGLTLTLNATASTVIAGDTSLTGAPVATANIDEWSF